MPHEVHREMVATASAIRGLSRGSRNIPGLNNGQPLPDGAPEGEFEGFKKAGWLFRHPLNAELFKSPFRKYAAARVALIITSMVATSLIIGDGVRTL